MALVVLLRGVNVGGHRTFRPARLAAELAHLGVVNLGAAGTFVVREAVGRTRLRAELARRLPFATEIVICEGREILGLLARDFFSGEAAGRDLVRFVSVLARAPASAPAAPFTLPPGGEPLVTVLAREGRFVVGVYRRQMKAIAALGALDRLFGVPVTTRQWSTLAAIGRALAR
jgi:uncharacterized protein (DUF1697 family)